MKRLLLSWMNCDEGKTFRMNSFIAEDEMGFIVSKGILRGFNTFINSVLFNNVTTI